MLLLIKALISSTVTERRRAVFSSFWWDQGPPAFKTGDTASGGNSEPPTETGESPQKGVGSGGPQVTQRDASIHSRPRLTQAGERSGMRPQETQRSTWIAASPRLTNGRSPRRRDRRSTDQRNTARAVPAASARTEQGAKRMTGLVTRDSAQRRPIDKHRSDARKFLTDIADRLSPTRPTGCRRAAPDSCPSTARLRT